MNEIKYFSGVMSIGDALDSNLAGGRMLKSTIDINRISPTKELSLREVLLAFWLDKGTSGDFAYIQSLAFIGSGLVTDMKSNISDPDDAEAYLLDGTTFMEAFARTITTVWNQKIEGINIPGTNDFSNQWRGKIPISGNQLDLYWRPYINSSPIVGGDRYGMFYTIGYSYE